MGDNLSGDRLSAYQAKILPGDVLGPKQAACLGESYHNCFVHYSQLLSVKVVGFQGKNGIQWTLRDAPLHVAKTGSFE